MEETGAPEKRSFIHSWGFKAPAIAAAILVLLWVVSELAVPRIASSVARNEIQQRYPDAQDVSVTIKAFPALKIAFKRYDSLTVSVSQVTLQGVKFEQIELESSEWPVGTFTGLIGEEEIERFFSIKNSYISDPVLTLEQGGIGVAGNVEVASVSVTVKATGQLESTDGRAVFFRPSDIQVSGVRVPSEGVSLVRQVMDENAVFTVREDLPYTITGIVAGQNELEISGTVNLDQALNITL